jgi:predicted MFS family arabinose efflux permease
MSKTETFDIPNTGVRLQPALWTMAVGTFAVGTDAFIVAGFLPELARSLSTSAAAAGQSVTIFAIIYALAAPAIGAFTARVPRRWMLVGSLLVLALANVAAAASSSLTFFIVARIIAAVGAAGFTPTASATAAALSTPERRGRALAIVIGGLTVATAVGVPLGFLVGRIATWRDSLFLVAALCVAAAILLAVVLPLVQSPPPVPLSSRFAALRSRGVAEVLPLTVLGMIAAYVLYAYSRTVLSSLGAPTTSVLWLLGVYGIGAVAGSLSSGWLTDRVGAVRILMIGYALLSVVMATIALTPHGKYPLPAVGALMFIWGASSWCQTPPQQHRLIAVAPGATALTFGLNSSAIYIGIGLGTLVGGLSLPSGLAVAGWLAAAIAASALCYLTLTRRLP